MFADEFDDADVFLNQWNHSQICEIQKEITGEIPKSKKALRQLPNGLC